MSEHFLRIIKISTNRSIMSKYQAMMSKLSGYSSNGSIHLITNNLIGFTSQQGTQCSSFTAGDIG